MCALSCGSLTLQKEIHPGCWVGPVEAVCKSNRILTRSPYPHPECYGAFVHKNCVCNELIALRGRVVGKVPTPLPESVNEVRGVLHSFTHQCKTTKTLTREEVVAKYHGAKKARYENARLSLLQREVTRTDAIVSGFVKDEKLNPLSKQNPDPRMIQCRNARYNIELACFLRPIEHEVYRLKRNGRRVMGKGLDQTARAALIQEKWEAFRNPRCLSIDASRFDQHVDISYLKLEHWFYTRLNGDPEFKKLLKMQERNMGFTSQGIPYKTVGKRMSGDMNTASGNCVLMFAMLTNAMRRLGINRWDCAVDGDDTLIFVEADDYNQLNNGLTGEFLRMGHEIKLEGNWSTLEGITWCQGKMTWCSGSYRLIKPWNKFLSVLTAGCRHWHEPSVRKDIAYTVGECIMCEYWGVPIIQEYCAMLMRAGGTTMKDKWSVIYYVYADALGLSRHDPTDIDAETRESFARVWSMPVDEQLLLEEQIRKSELPMGSVTWVPLEHDGFWCDGYSDPL